MATATVDLDPYADPVGYFISLARMDWVVGAAWNRLHALAGDLTEVQRRSLEDYEVQCPGPIRFACGRVGAFASIPGIFSRMGKPRCQGCCRVTGLPQGIGSPKNDDACRTLLGLACRTLLGLPRQRGGGSSENTRSGN
jgi:hypothetical protein